MRKSLPHILWNQFGGALQMLENALVACPPEVWGGERHPRAFGYLAHHTLFWTDYYLSEATEETFQPPAPFAKGEFEPEGVLPGRVYMKEELPEYLTFVWARSRTFVKGLTPERAQERFAAEYKDFSLLELTKHPARAAPRGAA